MFQGMQISNFVIIVDNHVIPTQSLLHRVRTREMMERSQARWDATPAGSNISNNASLSALSFDDHSASIASPGSNGSHTRLNSSTNSSFFGPKVPRRQISPPALKRDAVEDGETTSASSAAVATNSSTGTSSTSSDRPHLPVRSKSPLVLQHRTEDDMSSSDSSSDNHPSERKRWSRYMPPSPMVPSRHHLPTEQPRMPKRKASVKTVCEEYEIQQLLQSDGNDDEMDLDLEEGDLLSRKDAAMDDNESHQSQQSQQDSEPSFSSADHHHQGQQPRRPSRRPSLPSRQSSFEILPATLPTRQSSFEIRHRASVNAAASPLSQRVVAELLQKPGQQRPPPSLPSATSTNFSLTAVAIEPLRSRPHQRSSWPSAVSRQEEDPPKAPAQQDTSSCDEEEATRFHSSLPTILPSGVRSPSSLMVATAAPAKQTSALTTTTTSTSREPSSSFGSSHHSTTSSASSSIIKNASPHIPIRRNSSLDSCSSNDSSSSSSSDATPSGCGGGAKAPAASKQHHRFRNYRVSTGVSQKPSLPVRTSSFDLSKLSSHSTHSHEDEEHMLPCRQSSFPGLRTTLQKL